MLMQAPTTLWGDWHNFEMQALCAVSTLYYSNERQGYISVAHNTQRILTVSVGEIRDFSQKKLNEHKMLYDQKPKRK